MLFLKLLRIWSENVIRRFIEYKGKNLNPRSFQLYRIVLYREKWFLHMNKSKSRCPNNHTTHCLNSYRISWPMVLTYSILPGKFSWAHEKKSNSLSQFWVTVQFGTMFESECPGEDASYRIRGCRISLLVFSVMPCNCPVGCFGFDGFAVRVDENTRHQSQRTVTWRWKQF